MKEEIKIRDMRGWVFLVEDENHLRGPDFGRIWMLHRR